MYSACQFNSRTIKAMEGGEEAVLQMKNNQFYGISINIDVQLKKMNATERPQNSGWYMY
jgi:hypothetical protein